MPKKKEKESTKKINTEEIKVKGKNLVNEIKRLIHEANVRKIKIKRNDKIIMEVPLSLGSIGIIAAPVIAAIGGLAAMLTECTIVVEKEIEDKE
jgi:hypothetical protein